MKKLVTVCLLFVTIGLLSGCSKLKVDSQLIVGTWTSYAYYKTMESEPSTYTKEKYIFLEDGTAIWYDSGSIVFQVPYVFDNTKKTLTFKDGKEDLVYEVYAFENNSLIINYKEYYIEYRQR
ncbi:MAG: hypothetical protein PHD11_06650 [Bacteroidales bacterium]|nr:hypothetical protein [Bacteroidales bacterium]MDD4670845.1 hypothetical protein [Bacteroidales bacterium]